MSCESAVRTIVPPVAGTRLTQTRMFMLVARVAGNGTNGVGPRPAGPSDVRKRRVFPVLCRVTQKHAPDSRPRPASCPLVQHVAPRALARRATRLCKRLA